MGAVRAVDALWEPLRLGASTARNRIVFAPHTTNLAVDGLPGEDCVAYYERRATGGAGLIVLEEAQVHPSSRPYQRAIRGYDPAAVPAYRRLAERLHALGALAVLQLNHAGMQGTGHIDKRELWAPSPVPNAATLEMPKVMEPEDVAKVVEGFAHTARHAAEAGLDGVEVNAGQFSLVRQFLSGLTNQRGDEYGEDRLRFAREVLAAVRREADGRLVGLRLSCDELAPWAGITPEAAPELAAALAPDVDYVSVVVGSIYSPHATRAGMHRPPGYALDLAASVRGAVDGVPVLASGSLVEPAQAAEALSTHQADAVEMTRALIADPDLPLKVSEGRGHEIRPCIRCNQDCVVRSASNARVSCIHNPEAGWERGWPAIKPASRARRVLVVGGGPAGMEAARVAALRGHEVTLLERAAALGGTPRLVAEAGQRQPLGEASAWLEARLRELPVDVRPGVEATEAAVLDADPEWVVLATGGRARELPQTWLTVRQALGGELPGAGRVVVVDRQGGYPAIDAARAAAERGRPVTFLTEDTFCSSQLGATGELTPWYEAAAALGVELRPMTTVTAAEPGRLRVRHRFSDAPEAAQEWVEADCVVLADHEVPDDALYHALQASGVEVRRAGDCLAPRRVLHAVLEGGRVGREIA
jgi:mycofactocin system FadH/OYE family oxidoreductase 2